MARPNVPWLASVGWLCKVSIITIIIIIIIIITKKVTNEELYSKVQLGSDFRVLSFSTVWFLLRYLF